MCEIFSRQFLKRPRQHSVEDEENKCMGLFCIILKHEMVFISKNEIVNKEIREKRDFCVILYIKYDASSFVRSLQIYALTCVRFFQFP